MAFPQSFLDELVARNDIVDVVGSYVQLTRKGANLFGLCPFHSEKTGSFSVSPDKQIYYCFGCKRGGGVINFIMEEENLPFPDAVRFLAKRAGMEVPEEDGDREESDSVGNQKMLLLDYLRGRPDMELQGIYTDDGYTGTSFDRPAFKRMLDEIRAGRIGLDCRRMLRRDRGAEVSDGTGRRRNRRYRLRSRGSETRPLPLEGGRPRRNRRK